MKVNPFKNPALKADSKMNAFPLSHTESFTAPFGALIPCVYYHLTAGSKIKIDMENQTILTPVIRPPFARMFEHFEFFAVPMAQIHQAFDNVITNQSNYENSAVLYFNRSQEDDFVGAIPSQVPMFSSRLLEGALYYLQTKADVFGCAKHFNACRLLDMLGYGNFYEFCERGLDAPNEVQPDDIQSNIRFILPQNYYNLAAYQKIYYSHYCNTRYEQVKTTAFNLDDMTSAVHESDGSSETSDIKRLESMLELHYRWKTRDYFTCVQPNVLPTAADFGFTETKLTPVKSTIWQVFGVPGTLANTQSQRPIIQTDFDADLTNVDGNKVLVGNSSQMYVGAIRFAFAYDKLLRRMRQAGSDFNSQMLAQFGVVPSDARHGAAKYLGGYTNQLRFDEVTSTTQNDHASLGDIAGKMTSYNVNRRTIEYEAKENTIIMCIYSTSVESQYHSFNQDRVNLRRFRFDWFNEAFQDLGLQAVYNCEYSNVSEQAARDEAAVEFENQTTGKIVLGYNRRYMEYKTKLNKVHGLLQWPYNNPDGKAWVVQNNDLRYNEGYDLERRYTTLRHAPFNYSNLVINPMTLNDIVSVAYSGRWNTDHFNVFGYFNTRIVAPISADGEVF